MRILILALCSLIYWNCYTIPYERPARSSSQRDYAPEPNPGYRLSLFESVFSQELGSYITFEEIIYETDSSSAELILRIDLPPKTSVIHIKPKLGIDQYIGDYEYDYKTYLIFKEIDLSRKRIRFQIKLEKKAFRLLNR
ncbi:MAG TPA: hypothetical protein VHP30_13980 [Ignavibacteriales bacterium]|nr:hypothetical protein [Ignavibacteriales bacterium]